MRRIFAVILCAALLVLPVRAEAAPKYAALTFDDGPSGRFTRRLLDGLAARQVRATFMLCGYRIADYPGEARRIWEEGHEIAIHGYSHNSMCAMTKQQIVREIENTVSRLPEGCAPVFLRPPGGLCSDAVNAAAKEMGLAVLTWSVDPKDWATHDTDAIVRRVTQQTKDGDVILLHDMSESSVNAALDIVDDLLSRGYRFATVSELAAMRSIRIVPGKTFCSFPRRAVAAAPGA